MIYLMPTVDLIIAQSKNWIKEFVIKYNFCPFAKNAFVQDKIHFIVDETASMLKIFEYIVFELQLLEHHADIETSFIIYPDQFDKFENYLEFYDTANALLKTLNYEGVYQFASFHPEYIFEGSDEDDPANFTNRSPYPMLHILRENSVEKALMFYDNPEKIPQQNIIRARELGLGKMKALREACFNVN